MRADKKSLKVYLCLHLGLLAAALFFPLYRALTDRLPALWIKCFLHDRLFLYCPLCGGTRAIEALLRLDFVGAFTANPLVVVFLFLALILDAVILIRLLGGKKPLLPFPHLWWTVPLAVMIVYAVVRNWLMIAYHYDPIGDLGTFWQR